MAFCGNCGASIGANAKFCGGCGQTLTFVKEASSTPNGPAPVIGETGQAMLAGAAQIGSAAVNTVGTVIGSTASAAHSAAASHSVVGGEHVRYDEFIIAEFANAMYRRAFWVIVVNTLLGTLVGWGVGSLAGVAFGFGGGGGSDGFWLITMFIGGAVGFWMGQQKAFSLKLMAQSALCQVQIERNTRAAEQPEKPVRKSQ